MATPLSSTVVKAFAVLELFGNHTTVTPAQCAEALDIPRSTCHRLLTTLASVGVLDHASRDHFTLSLKLFQLGSLAPLRRRLCDRARLPLERIARETGLSTNMGARDGYHVVLLETIPGRFFSIPTRVGHRAPLHSTALGKVLLANADDCLGFVESATTFGLHSFTHRTICDPAELRAELQQVRLHGYATEIEEMHRDTACLAVPVRMSDNVVAAISISYPLAKRREEAGYRTLLSRAAREIERGVAWQGSLNWHVDDPRSTAALEVVRQLGTEF